MEHYVTYKKHENDLIILHFGTNDLQNNQHSHDIAQGIINVAVDMKTENNEVMISGIITVYNFNFIDNYCISKERHLNNGDCI